MMVNKAETKALQEDGENKPLNPLSAEEGNYMVATVQHLISSLCAIVLYLISTIVLNTSSSL